MQEVPEAHLLQLELVLVVGQEQQDHNRLHQTVVLMVGQD